METLQNIQKIFDANYFLVVAIVLLFVLIVQIALWIDRHYMKKEIRVLKAGRDMYAGKYFIKIDEKIEEMKLHEKTLKELSELKQENAHILKVNKGMCLRKESISKEIIDDLNLRKTAIGEALRVVRNGHFNINAPDVANVVTETADGVYAFLTGKA